MRTKIIVTPPIVGPYRMTLPVREAFLRAGNEIAITGIRDTGCDLVELLTCHEMRRPPDGNIMVCLIGYAAMHGRPDTQHYGLRFGCEPEFPCEWPNFHDKWQQGYFAPCYKCGASVVWHEAGYVPGYRICLNGHHSMLSDDGRKTRKPTRV